MLSFLKSQGRGGRPLKAAALFAAGLCVCLSTGVAAQNTAPKARAPQAGGKGGAPAKQAQPAKPATATKGTATKDTVAEAAEEQQRAEILKSPEWRQTLHDFEQWLSIQTIYTPEEVKQIQSRLSAGIGRMSPAQMQFFMTDMQDKLKVLNSDQGQQAAAYLAQTFAVASPAYARKLRQKLPDVLSMTAAQINQKLLVFAAKHQATIDMQKSFEDAKQAQIAYNQQQLATQLQESDKALDRAEASAAAAGSGGPKYTAARDYFPNAGNDGPFGPGTSIGFWGGGFF